MCDKLKTDRCVDLFRKPGEKGHCGKDLRRVSGVLIKQFPSFHPDSRICAACRKKSSDLNSNEMGESSEANISDSDVSYNADSCICKDEENLDSRASPEPEARSQREIDLEEMLDGLKTKFSSLGRNVLLLQVHEARERLLSSLMLQDIWLKV